MQVNSNNTLLGREPYQKNRYGLKENSNYQTAFCAEQKQLEAKQEKPDSKLDVKTITNILGVAAWLFMVGFTAKNLKWFDKKSPEYISRTVKTAKTKARSYMEDVDAKKQGVNVDEVLNGKSGKVVTKSFFKLGSIVQNAKTKYGSELFNNLIYAFGTVVVLPLTVLLAPSKKDTTKEDKFFTIIRQPISMISGLGMQFTFDKLIDRHVPEVIASNKFEDSSILIKNEKGKMVVKIADEKGNAIEENISKIKYNKDSAKEGFKLFAKKLLNDAEIKELFDVKTYEDTESSDTYFGKLKNILNKKYENKGLKLEDLKDIIKKSETFDKFRAANSVDAKNMEDVVKKLDDMTKVFNNHKLVVQKPKTIVNVFIASVIGCTFLNVVYGKMMKGIKENKEQKKHQEITKEVK